VPIVAEIVSQKQEQKSQRARLRRLLGRVLQRDEVDFVLSVLAATTVPAGRLGIANVRLSAETRSLLEENGFASRKAAPSGGVA
jgi:hypothetical protein